MYALNLTHGQQNTGYNQPKRALQSLEIKEVISLECTPINNNIQGLHFLPIDLNNLGEEVRHEDSLQTQQTNYASE